MSDAVNPYAPPVARVDDSQVDSAAQAIRRAHINTEASTKTVGILYYLGGVIATLIAFQPQTPGDREAKMAMMLLFLALAIGLFFAGWGVRALRRWGRVLGCVLSTIGLLDFPIGTLVNGYILYLFVSKKGRMVFSPEYREVIAATPDVKYRASRFVVGILVLLLVIFAALMLYAFLR